MWPEVQIPSEIGKVNFLTIQESWVKTGTTQRRPGLHVDSPGKVKIKNEESKPLLRVMVHHEHTEVIRGEMAVHIGARIMWLS